MSKHRIARHEYRLNVLPLAVAAIVVLTAIPIDLRGAVGWDGKFDYQDFAENLLLFLPLGVALWRRPTATVLICAALLSVLAETVQLWSFERYSSPYDVLSNVLGAFVGARAWRHIAGINDAERVTIKITHRWIAAAAIVTALLLTLWNLPTRSSAISSWNTQYPLLLGNERTGDRPWQGTIDSLALLPSALSRADVRALAMQGESDDALVKRHAAYVASNPIVLDGGAGVVLPGTVSQALAEQAMHNNGFAVIARFETANLLQDGPARIVSFSTDPFHRNFDLGQEAGTLVFRINTPTSRFNGADIPAVTPPILNAHERTLVVATYDGAIAKIYVDGVLEARRNIAATGCLVPLLCDAGAPPAWTAFGALLAVIALAFTPWRSRLQLVSVATLTGALSFAVLRFAGSDAMDIFHDSWLPLMSIVGATTVGISTAREPSHD